MTEWGLLGDFDEKEDMHTRMKKKLSQGFLTDEELDEIFVGQGN